MKIRVKNLIMLIAAVFIFYFLGSGCPQQALFGISCLGCGMTRAYIQLLHGNVKGAFFYHPAFWSVPIAAIVLFFHNKIPKKLFYAILIFIFLFFLFVYLYRLSIHDPVLRFDIREGWFYKVWKCLQELWFS